MYPFVPTITSRAWIAPRDVSTTVRPSAFRRTRSARVSSWSAAPAPSASAASPATSLPGCSPALRSTTIPPKYASLPISSRRSARATTCAGMSTARSASTVAAYPEACEGA